MTAPARRRRRLPADPHEAALHSCPSCGFRPRSLDTDGSRNPRWVQAAEDFVAIGLDPALPFASTHLRVAVLASCNIADHGRNALGEAVTLAVHTWTRVPRT